MGEREGEKKMEQRLEEAAIQGETASLKQILGEDPLILRRVITGCFVHTPLHVAASEGHLEFVRELLANNKALSGVLDPRGWSALHVAAANGRGTIVEKLLEADDNMCLTLDSDGRNPLHLAALKGHAPVLRVFFEKKPDWIPEFLKTMDGGGNTILHLAVKDRKFEVVKLLLVEIKDQVKAKNIQKTDNPLNMINKCGCTSLDILETLKCSEEKDFNYVKKKFRKAGASKADALKAAAWETEHVSKRQNALMMAASLIATMAFQAGVSPPGGVWEGDQSPSNLSPTSSPEGYKAGESVNSISDHKSSTYGQFLYANTIGFVASLSIILFLVTGLPFKKRFFTRIMVLVMCITVASMAITYTNAIDMINPNMDDPIYLGVIIWVGVMCVFVVIHTIPFLNKCLKLSWHIIRSLVKLFMKFIRWSSNPLMKSSKKLTFTSAPSNQRLPTSSI